MGTALFLLEAFELGSLRRAGFVPDLRWDRGKLYQLTQALHGIFAIALLSTKPPGFDDNFARGSHALTRQTKKTVPDLRSNRLRVAGVKTKLDRRGYLIDILAAGARSPYEFKLDFLRAYDH